MLHSAACTPISGRNRWIYGSALPRRRPRAIGDGDLLAALFVSEPPPPPFLPETANTRSLTSVPDDRSCARILLNLGFRRVMAMETSLGKRSLSTNAWNMVVTSRPATVTVAMPDSPMESATVRTLLTSVAYVIVAIDALVIGNVYAHHAREKRNPGKS